MSRHLFLFLSLYLLMKGWKGGVGSSSFHHSKSLSSWAPECLHEGQNFCVLSFPLPLHCLYGQNRNTVDLEQKTTGEGWGEGVERVDIFLLWLNWVIAQVGWFFWVLENHLLSRKMIASKCWLEGECMRAEGVCVFKGKLLFSNAI